MKKATGIFTLMFILSGCGGMPIPDPEKETVDMKEEVEKQNDVFESNEPAITEIKTKPLVIKEPEKFPDEIRNKKISIDLSRNATIQDLAGVFEVYNLNLVITESVSQGSTNGGTASQTNNQNGGNQQSQYNQNQANNGDSNQNVSSSSNFASGEPLLVRKFDGTLEEYLVLLSELYNVSFDYKGNQIVVMQEYSDYTVNLPQFPEGDDATITSDILDTIKNLGAENVQHSLISGMVNYQATPFSQEKIEEYLKTMIKSVSVINLQTAIVTVKLDQERSKGFDWSQLQMNFAKDLPGVLDGPTSMISENVFGENMGSNLSDMEGGAQLGRESVNFSFAKEDFSFSSVINFLNTYGKTETNQSVLMRTLSGKEVVLKSGQQVPYVSDLNSNATGDNVSSGIDTATEETGIDLSILPYFDSSNEIVTARVKLTIKSILSFLDLSTGNSTNTIQQPNVQNQEFESVIRLGAGQTTVIGGIMFDSVEDKRTGNAYLGDSNVSAENLTIEKSAVFIMLRPTVKIFSEEFDNTKIIEDSGVKGAE